MAKILICGGNGMLGRALSDELLNKGHRVNWLCRSHHSHPEVEVYLWNPDKKLIDAEAFKDVDHLVNLSGSNIGDKRWTRTNKEKIYSSRVASTAFLLQTIAQHQIQLKSICGASAIGYYGTEHEEEWCDENMAAGSDFLARVCRDWEAAYSEAASPITRVVILRIGIVLSREGGIYARLRPICQSGLAAVFGQGKNYLSWIHQRDLTNILVYSILNQQIQGVYNAVGPEPSTLNDFTKGLALSLNRKLWLPNLPGVLLKIAMGERSLLVLKGCRASSHKVVAAGYRFIYPNLAAALKSITG